MKKLWKILILSIFVLLILFFIYKVLDHFEIFEKRLYTAKDFNIEIIRSNIDYNKNGIDDYTDILLGARQDAKNKPKYKEDSYTSGGYPPDDIGVCADVIWRALKNAGYDLKSMMDEDIRLNQNKYPAINEKPDSNIDFRRVRNQKVFFERYTIELTNDIYQIAEFQPGDIVVFGKNYNHIGIISDKRNEKGIPYLIHNAGQPKREEDILETYVLTNPITGHYRFELNENADKLLSL